MVPSGNPSYESMHTYVGITAVVGQDTTLSVTQGGDGGGVLGENRLAEDVMDVKQICIIC